MDDDAPVVTRWRQDDTRPEIISEQLVWQPDPARWSPLIVELARLFEDVFAT